jgi:hypothetical protein
MSYYQIKNGKAEQVTELPNVSGVDLYLASITIADRQARGIFANMVYSAQVSEATADHALDTIFAPMPPEPIKETSNYDRIKLLDALAKRNLLQVFDSFMANDAKARWYFTTATVIEESHPVFISAMTAMVQVAGVSQEEVNAILEESKA